MKQIKLNLEFPDSSMSCTCYLEKAGFRKYKLVSSPIMCKSTKYGDIIKIKRTLRGKHQFIKVVEESKYEHICRVLSKEFIESEEFQAFLGELEAKDIYWQAVFGGGFTCCPAPENKQFVEQRLNELCS